MFERILAVMAVSCVLAVPRGAAADQPEHLKLEFPDQVVEGPFPAGAICDFAYQMVASDEVVNVIRFYDDAGVRVRAIIHDAYTVVHMNLDDPASSLVERVHYTVHRDLVTREETVTGNMWHLRSVTDGDLVFVGSGRYVVDLNTGEILEATPGTSPDFAGTICTALGGAPAE